MELLVNLVPIYIRPIEYILIELDPWTIIAPGSKKNQ